MNGTVTARYMYDSLGRLMAELDDAGNLVSRFVYGTRGHVPDYMIKSDVEYRFALDPLGSVRRVIKVSDGTVAQNITYTDLGMVVTDSSPGFQPFGYAGGLYDSATGLVRFGARDYDASVGRWTMKDPILFAGGDTNLYGYVLSDPINFIDPKGLWAVVIGGGFSGVFGGGTEGSVGFYIGTDKGGNFNGGFFGTGGAGIGGSVGVDVFGGYYNNTCDIPGSTNNVNVGAGPFTGSSFWDDKSGNWVGGTIGFGPSLPVGLSGSHTNTSTWSVFGN